MTQTSELPGSVVSFQLDPPGPEVEGWVLGWFADKLNTPLPHPENKWIIFRRLPDGRRSIHDITKELIAAVRKQSTCRHLQRGGRSRSGELLFPFLLGYEFIVRQSR
jgi:hypothetical protein